MAYNSESKPEKQSLQAELTIVICVRDALEDTQACLRSVEKHTADPFNLVIVDDASTAATRSFIEDFRLQRNNCLVIRNEQPQGYTVSANKGLASATGSHVILLNSDTVVTKEWDRKLIGALQRNPRVAISSPLSNAALYQSIPRVADIDGSYCINTLPAGYELDHFAELVQAEFPGQTADVLLANGFCLCIRASLLKEIGGFNERDFPLGYGEETDFCLRTRLAGYLIHVALDTYIYHAKSRSFTHEVRVKLSQEGRIALDRLYGSVHISTCYSTMLRHPRLNYIRRIFYEKYFK